MAYVSAAELRQRLGATLYARLTDRIEGRTADDAVGAQIVAEAEGEAHSYLAARYATPIDLARHPELADVLTQRVLDLAEYLAWRGSPFVSDIPQRVQKLYEDARRWLEALAAGSVALPAAAPPASTTATDEAPRYRATPRKFTADELDAL